MDQVVGVAPEDKWAEVKTVSKAVRPFIQKRVQLVLWSETRSQALGGGGCEANVAAVHIQL